MNKIKSVASISLSRSSQGKIRLEVKDHHSSDRVLEINMSPKELGLLITGLSEVKGEMEYYQHAEIGKARNIIRETCDKVLIPNELNHTQEQLVKEDFESKYDAEIYKIQSNGIGTQQPSDKHQYTVKYYTDVENVFDVKRYY